MRNDSCESSENVVCPRFLMAAALVFASAACAAAESYPLKPIRFVIEPSPDLLARMVGQKLSESWSQQVIVDARPGAGGAIAVDIVSHAAPDGYTWLMSSSSIAINQAVYPTTT